MSKKLDTINNSAALEMGRSQYVGTATDDTLIMEYREGNIINVNGHPSPYAVIIQKLAEDTSSIEETGLVTALKKVHLPKQIKILGANSFAGAIVLEEINLENISTVGDIALAGVASEGSKTIVLHLDNVTEVGEDAFVEANAEIYLNKNVEDVFENAFAGAKTLHYSGNLEGAPWGALEWIKD